MHSNEWNRRRFLGTIAGTIAGVAALRESSFATKGKPLKATNSAGTESPHLEAPLNAVDCHHHIYDWRYPFVSSVTIRPPEATASDYLQLQQRLGIVRNVVVQPTQYGEDNSLVLASLKDLGEKNTRAIVVVPPTIGDAELKQMHQAGVRGMRFDCRRTDGVPTWEVMEPLAERFAPLGLHVQIYANGDDICAHKVLLNRLPCPIVFDHLARMQDAGPVKERLFATVCDLMKQGKAWTKVVFDVSKVGPPTYADTVEVARAFAKEAPDRLLWGTNWPHPALSVKDKPDDAVMFDLLSQVAPEATIREQILVDNPARLYGF